MHALSDPTRWRIIALLRGEALCVCELVDVLDLAQSTLSSHLQVMRTAGVVNVEKREKWAYYSLDVSKAPLIGYLCHHFSEELEGDAVLEQDRRRMTERLALRGRTDCDGPRRAIPPAIPARAGCC